MNNSPPINCGELWQQLNSSSGSVLTMEHTCNRFNTEAEIPFNDQPLQATLDIKALAES